MEDKNHDPNQQKCWPRNGREPIEIHGGHIVRSTAKKDRHSKVYTAKGLRDRRVRLSAHTAIQFYDVQDRLGYDRPSKAVDWLMQNAKAAIDQLDERSHSHVPTERYYNGIGDNNSSKRVMLEAKVEETMNYGFDSRSSSGSFLPPPETGAIAGTVKCLPMARATASGSFSSSSFIYDQNRTQDPLQSTSTSSHIQDLSISHPSFQEPIFQQGRHNQSHDSSLQTLFAVHGTNLAQDATSVSWTSAAGTFGSGRRESVLDVALPLHSAHGQGHHFLSQREPLQSSNLSMDLMTLQPPPFSIAGSGVFTSTGYADFSGFNIPTRIWGETEQDSIGNKLYFAPSPSRQ